MGIAAGDRIGTLAFNHARHLEAWYGERWASGGGGPHPEPAPAARTARLYRRPRRRPGDPCRPPVRAPSTEGHTMPRYARRWSGWSISPTKAEAFSSRRRGWASNPGSDGPAYRRTATWGSFDENTAARAFATPPAPPAIPRGVLYSHRSNVLHTFMSVQPGRHDGRLPAGRDPADRAHVPRQRMGHRAFPARRWGPSWSAARRAGSTAQPRCTNCIETEGVTFLGGGRADGLADAAATSPDAVGGELTTLKRVTIGGSVCPESMMRIFHDRYGVDVLHAWGMTEMSPLGLGGRRRTAAVADLPFLRGRARWSSAANRAARPSGVEMRIEDDDGRILP